MDEQVLQSLTEAINKQTDVLSGLQTKQAGWTTATTLHGPGGIFQGPGLERDVITAHVRPQGIASILAKIPANSTDPRFAALTGYTDIIGDEVTNACDDAPYGYVKSCNLTARFGLLRRDTGTIEMDDVMLRINRGDFTDLMLRGRVLGLTEGLSPSGLNESQILNILTMSEMVGAAAQAERALNTRYWSGAVALGQMPGLDNQIATGQVDADQNQACPALDSDVKDFEYNDVCGTSRDIVEYVSMMHWYLKYNAMTMGLEPVQWAVAMRPELWFELTSCWPCRYNSYRCSAIDYANQIDVTPNLDAADMVQIRDQMRAGMYIWVNGVQLPVVIDTGITELNPETDANLNPGEFASSIYFVPLSITGNFPVTYIEYIDYRQAGMDRALLQGREDWWWTDNGLWSWAIEQEKWCYRLNLKTEQRIVLRTPHLAGKVEHVMYSPLQHLRSPDPDSPYHADGGVSVRPSGTTYAVWM